MPGQAVGWRAAVDDLRELLATYDWGHLTDARRRILDAFLEIATRSGYSSVTMRGIGRELNIKAPSLYSHFPGGKDELVAEVLRWHQYRFMSVVVAELADQDDPEAAWDTLVRVHVRRQLELPEYEMWDLLLATDRVSRVLDDRVRAEVQTMLDVYEALFVATAKDMGCPARVRAVAVVISILDGVTSWARRAGAELDVDEAVAAAQRITRGVLEVTSDLAADR